MDEQMTNEERAGVEVLLYLADEDETEEHALQVWRKMTDEQKARWTKHRDELVALRKMMGW